ncbi:MAG: lysophospholipid acyltransferase family protein [Candidatus Dormibacteria bacterium]
MTEQTVIGRKASRSGTSRKTAPRKNSTERSAVFDMLRSMRTELAELHERRTKGEYTTDDFGFDPVWTETILPLAKLVYDHYWRVDVSGVENIPLEGGALLVSNHAGVFPFDAAMIKVAVLSEGPSRHVRALVADWMFNTPFLSWFIRRAGQTLGHPDDTFRLLSGHQLVLVFPEGIRGTGKPFSERYRLRRFGRGGFVEAAARAHVPIIPVSVVGSEETYPMLGEVPYLNKLMGVPYVPITPTLPLLGPLGLVPLPSKWSIHFHPPIQTDTLVSTGASRAADIMDVTELVRRTIQDGLRKQLMDRRSVFFG